MKTKRLVLNLTPDEAADLAVAVNQFAARRAEYAETVELDPTHTLEDERTALRLAERARTLQGKVTRAYDGAR